jgi:hypothetical protein
MANATAITVNSLAESGNIALPTPDAMDTGTAAVTLAAAVGGESSRVILIVNNTAAANLVVSVLAGDKPPAERAGLGALVTANIAQNATRVLGPFEAARYIQDDGSLNVTFTPASGTIACNVTCYKLPKL